MKLAKTNNLPLDQFINLALYDKDKGYYMKRNPFGKVRKGQTVIEIGDLPRHK